MKPISFKRHRFPADVIRQAVWLYFRFSLGFRGVEELMAACGMAVSNEIIRFWTIKFGPLIGCCQGKIRSVYSGAVQCAERTRKRRNSVEAGRSTDPNNAPVGHHIQLTAPIVALP